MKIVPCGIIILYLKQNTYQYIYHVTHSETKYIPVHLSCNPFLLKKRWLHSSIQIRTCYILQPNWRTVHLSADSENFGLAHKTLHLSTKTNYTPILPNGNQGNLTLKSKQGKAWQQWSSNHNSKDENDNHQKQKEREKRKIRNGCVTDLI